VLVGSSDLDRIIVSVPFVPLVAYYLDNFVLAVLLGNCILATLVLMKNLPMKPHHPADAILLGVVHVDDCSVRSCTKFYDNCL